MFMTQSRVILFDGICNLCCGWVQFLIRHDNRMKFRFASIQSVIGQSMLYSVGISNKMLDSVVYLKGSVCFRESSAVLEILNDMGGIWKLFSVFKLIPNPIRDGIYRFIAKNRNRFFGKRGSCYSPNPENQKRFLT
jgi:predicted DCC family thiol-disulfide oxidoreductase YuxK